MDFLVIFVLLLFVDSILASDGLLSLNPQGRFLSEVQSVRHLPNANQIMIDLKSSRRCHKPTFRIRISGTSLVMMELKVVEANKLIYEYPQLADEGAYFVEVLGLLCTPFNPEHFVETCLEEVANGSNVITLPYTFHVEAKETKAEKRPRWLLSEKQNATILPTRYQKLGCMSEASPFWCPAKPSHIAQYDLYNWVDRPDYSKLLEAVLAQSQQGEKKGEDNIIRVCSIGDSHARQHASYGNKLGLKKVHFVEIVTTFPHEFDINWLKNYKCNYAVLTYGQWPASFMTQGHPYPYTKYHDEMRRVMTLLQKYDPKQSQVFVRSVNYNALGARQTACPPIDYRSPPVIDMFNSVLKQLAQELRVEYIDMNHIMGPMWDSALDWCHPEEKVVAAEVEWILHHMFQFTLNHKLVVGLFAPEYPENSLIRFSNGTTVYLLLKGQLRAFPNAHTFAAMGYDFGYVKALHVDKQSDFIFGTELPKL